MRTKRRKTKRRRFRKKRRKRRKTRRKTRRRRFRKKRRRNKRKVMRGGLFDLTLPMPTMRIVASTAWEESDVGGKIFGI
tara:strand:+ start:146 stop:382 length:237 start_codon:yes stop_codon:yes gene_type:complete